MKTTSVILKPRLIARSEIVPMMNRIELLFSAWELLLMDQQINFEKLIFSLSCCLKCPIVITHWQVSESCVRIKYLYAWQNIKPK
jgi:hypothetical protein